MTHLRASARDSWTRAMHTCTTVAWYVILKWYLAFLLLAHFSLASPPSTDDNFIPACGGLLPDPPPGGWLLWSSPAIWPGGVVPGVGSASAANVTIACGQGVLLDLPFVNLTVLNILGALKVRDDPSLPRVNITAAFIVVEGRFVIGTQAAQFRQRVEIRLVPNPIGRANFLYTARSPADPSSPRNLGHKAFAVVGGQVDFHGLPGPASMPSWTKLGATASAGDLSIIVRGNDVSSWPVGAPIVIAPTDYRPNEEDVSSIAGIAALGNSLWRITLTAPLGYNHFGDPYGVPDGFGGYIDETAEVALLTRNIVVTGTDEPPPYNLEGGHFIIFMTNTQQVIEGVQFHLMGQQGTLGRYSIHFHVCGDQSQSSSVVRKNLIIHSKQRCVVVHATFNLVVDGNVAYNTSGHCFMIEEGGETGNTFINNFGLRTRAVKKLIPLPSNPATSEETDNLPSTFWITNPNNNYINNAAGGSEDSGFWMELRFAVRGMSAMWAKVNDTIPILVNKVGNFSGNTAHSNLIGYRAYPHGFLPRVNGTWSNPRRFNSPVWVQMGGFTAFKNMMLGALLHDTDHVIFGNSSFADNPIGVSVHEVQGVSLTRLRFVGLSNNFGNPQWCTQPWGTYTCGPVTGCSFPLAPGVQGRSVTWDRANGTVLGVVFDENRAFNGFEDGSLFNVLSNSTFSRYDASCHPAAAIGVGTNRKEYWNTGTRFQGLKFDSKSPTNPVYLFPKIYTKTDGTLINAGEPATMFALYDYDGSVIGPSGSGYIVANNSGILPPSYSTICTPLPVANAYACPNVCYRTLVVSYFEPGFAPYPDPGNYTNVMDGPRTLGQFSYLSIKRLTDGKAVNLEGNLRQYGMESGWPDPSLRVFSVSLLGGVTYELTFVAPTGAPGFYPQNITLKLADGGSCQQPVTLRIRSPAGASSYWSLQLPDFATWTPCPGNKGLLSTAVAPLQFNYACSSTSSPPVQVLELFLSSNMSAGVPFTVAPVLSAPAACSTVTRCGLTSTTTPWSYNQLGQELHDAYSGGPAFYNPLYPTPSPDWQAGPGPLGYEGWAWPKISTFLQGPYTQLPYLFVYYFRATFNVTNSACYSGLLLDLIVQDGVVLYLNNAELLRVNMPSGPLTKDTQPLTRQQSVTVNVGYVYQSFFVPLGTAGAANSLVEGLNYLAAEVHVNKTGWEVAFALRATAQLSSACAGARVSPEVCDGVDNNNDGLVDVDPVTKKLLQRPCYSACGVGVQTCILGAYRNCTAPIVRAETCNGMDDDCDGCIDNGQGQLDCPNGTVCYAGRCRPVLPATTVQTVVQQQSPSWYYNDKGANVPGTYPLWAQGMVPLGTWGNGSAPFGFFPINASVVLATPLAYLTSAGGQMITRYFLKPFQLSAADAAATYGFSVAVRRGDGAVVYVNGQELFRTNMPAGPVTWQTPAVSWASSTNPTWTQNVVSFYPGGPLRSSGAAALTGTNWLAAELHSVAGWQQNLVFDMVISRFVLQTCPGGAGDSSCVRNPPNDTTLLVQGSVWKYLDASMALPPPGWMLPGFNDSAWPQGPAPLGNGGWWNIPTRIKFGRDVGNGRIVYYFRRNITVADGHCFYNLTLSLLDNDGAVVYINGAEALRDHMPAGNITAGTAANYWPAWKYGTWQLSGGWLNAGSNVIAVELHQMPSTTGNYVFDLGITGQREGVTCYPLPL